MKNFRERYSNHITRVQAVTVGILITVLLYIITLRVLALEEDKIVCCLETSSYSEEYTYETTVSKLYKEIKGSGPVFLASKSIELDNTEEEENTEGIDFEENIAEVFDERIIDPIEEEEKNEEDRIESIPLYTSYFTEIEEPEPTEIISDTDLPTEIISDTNIPIDMEFINVLTSENYSEIEEDVFNRNQLEYIGTFTVTGYDPMCSHCVGKTNPDNITASMEEAVVGQTVASSYLPFGTKIFIEGRGEFIVHDRCGNGHIDIATTSHSECYLMTQKNSQVYIILENEE